MNFFMLILFVVAQFGWELLQIDIKNVFLHGYFLEEIYMEQPLGFVSDFALVRRLKKSLYCLKQEPSIWYEDIGHFFDNLDFKHCEFAHNIYVLHVYGDILIVALYVNDLVMT